MTATCALFIRRTLLAVCLLVAGCQPPAGDLLPVPQQGQTLATSRFENDTAQATQDGVTVKAYGTWEGNGDTELTVVVQSAAKDTVSVDLAKSELVNNSQERGEVRFVKEKKGEARELVYSQYNADAYRPAEVKAGEKRSFKISFRYPFKEESRDVTSQSATLRVPATSGKDARAKNFEFVFRYGEAKVSRSVPDPID